MNLSHVSRRNLFTDWKTQINLVIPYMEAVPFDHPCFLPSTSLSLFYPFQDKETKLLTVFNIQTLDLCSVIVMMFVFFPFIVTPNIQPASLPFFLHIIALLLSFSVIEHKAHILVELSIITPKPFSTVAVTSSAPTAVYVNLGLFFPTCINLHLSKLNIINHFNEPNHSVSWGPSSTLHSNLVFFPPGIYLVLSAKFASSLSTLFSR